MPAAYPKRPIPLSITATTSPPRIASRIFPLPPKSEVPPITAAPTAYRSVELPPVVGETEFWRDAKIIPAIAANDEQIMNAAIRMRFTLIPARRAASAFPPTA